MRSVIDSIRRRVGRFLRPATEPSTPTDPEWFLAARLCQPDKWAVDVGADQGDFSKLVGPKSRACLAFEPRAAQALALTHLFGSGKSNVDVQPVALSDVAGVMLMRTLTKDPGRSTLDPANTLHDPDGSELIEYRVPVLRLDDYKLDEVALLKIDVEGHELAVLAGCLETIRRSRPALLVEIEERHHAGAIAAAIAMLQRVGYVGVFLHERQLRPIETFDANVLQRPENIGGWRDRWKKYGPYVNNFFFVSDGSTSYLNKCARDCGLIE